MEKTFSHRRLEVVEQRPMIGDFKNRWPALFEQCEVSKCLCPQVLLLSMVINGCNLYFAITLLPFMAVQVTCLYIVEHFSGECRVLADHHEATTI